MLDEPTPFDEPRRTGQVVDSRGVRDVMDLAPSIGDHNSRSGNARDVVAGGDTHTMSSPVKADI